MTDTQLAVPDEPSTDVSLPSGADDVNGLMELAIREKVPVEVLERLMDLHERVDARNARMAFFEALGEFQDECPEIPKSRSANIKTKSGGQYGYSYAPLESITRTIRPVLRRHGLSYSWDSAPGEKGVLNVICVLRHMDGHEERSTFPVPTGTEAAMSDAQKNGAALTYGRRQSLIAVLGLTAADDTDAPVPPSGSRKKVNAGQIADLESLLEETGSDEFKFLEWLGVDALEDMTMGEYDRGVKALEAKRKGR